jgi:hypothetical protein
VWNTRAQTTEELAHEIAVLHRHCNTAGRDPAQIRKTAAGLFKDTLDHGRGQRHRAGRAAHRPQHRRRAGVHEGEPAVSVRIVVAGSAADGGSTVLYDGHAR